MLRNQFKIALRNRRLLSIISLIELALTIAACNTLHSALTVQPGKQFKLGGNQKGAFRVQLKNTGDVPVTISEQQANGEQVTLGTFQPGEGQTVRFSMRSAALIDNASVRPAQLDLVVTGDTGLNMTETTKQ